MATDPAIPSLVLIPGESQVDYAALYAIAHAYAHSGLLISDYGKNSERHELSFPAIVCSSFAIELFLKFFLMLEKAENEGVPSKSASGHRLGDLWKKLSASHQVLIAGMFRNSTGVPAINSSDRRINLFEEALNRVGKQPFVEWRYAHELKKVTFMSHSAISEVVEALSYAATYAMKERSRAGAEVGTDESGAGEIKSPNQPEPPGPPGQGSAGGLLLLCGVEPLLLGRDSILRRIPVNINPKQVLFLDGIRHAVEILDVTYGRLREELTHLALHPPVSDELPDAFAHVFLDAWGFVYAVNRFCTLYMKMPGIKFDDAKEGVPTLRQATQAFRDLRKVADRLVQRADLVVSKDAGPLGELSWLTGAEIQPEIIAWHCILRPGTLRAIPSPRTAPITDTLDWPTGSIRLSAGGYEGNLSAVRGHVEVRIRHLETELQRVFEQPTQAQVPIINDMFERRPVKPAPTGSE